MPSGKRPYTIATIVKLDGVPWFERMREGVDKFGDETGHKCFLMGPPQANATGQVQLIEDVIAQGVDAICVVPFSAEAIEPVLRKARSHCTQDFHRTIPRSDDNRNRRIIHNLLV